MGHHVSEVFLLWRSFNAITSDSWRRSTYAQPIYLARVFFSLSFSRFLTLFGFSDKTTLLLTHRLPSFVSLLPSFRVPFFLNADVGQDKSYYERLIDMKIFYIRNDLLSLCSGRNFINLNENSYIDVLEIAAF